MIKLDKVNKHYYCNSNEFQALKDINLQIDYAEMVAIIGASGSGKSTLMNVMGFLDNCSTGKYYFSGRDVSALNNMELSRIRNKNIGFVFQSFFLLPRLNVLKNVMLPLLYSNEKKELSQTKALEVLNIVGMKNFCYQKPNQLSGGQQQRVAIARALVNNPEIILADEPTGSLDSKTSAEIMKLFSQLNINEKKTIVIITHDKNISLQCSRVITLKDGIIQQ